MDRQACEQLEGWMNGRTKEWMGQVGRLEGGHTYGDGRMTGGYQAGISASD